MKPFVWGLCLLGVCPVASAAFFQQTKDKPEDVPESPVKVNIQGGDEALQENMRALLPSLRNLKCDSSADRVERFIESSDEKLKNAAEAMGYFDARYQVTPVRQGNCLALNIAVQPGKPVKVTQVNAQLAGPGKNLQEFRDVMAKLPYQPGDVLEQQKYKDFKDNLTRVASNLGFFDAEFVTHEVRVDPDTYQAQVDLQFDTGNRYRVGKVAVQQDVLDQKHLQRFLRVRQGEPYDVAKLLEQQRLLDGSGYYSDVQVLSKHQKAENGQVPVDIDAIRGKRYSYAGKLGYGSDTGVRTEAGMTIHWVNSKGHSLDTKAVVAQKEKSVEATYKIPLFKPEHEYTSISAGWQKSDNDDIKSSGFKASVDYNRRSERDWQQTVFINYLNEKTQVRGEPETHAQLTLLGAKVKKVKSNDLLFPTKGWMLSAQVQGAKKGVLSDQNVVQGIVNGKYLHTFDNQGKVILQGVAGATHTNDFNDLPKSLRFFAGGQSSVRGYDFESLGDKNAKGEVIGGKYLLTSSFEYEHPIRDKWSAATFVDAGNAFSDTSKVKMKVGMGVGVRWKSPLGPVRADLAVPKDDTKDLHFYFSLGPDL